MREKDIERYLVARVKSAGGEIRKVQWIGRRSAPDRLVMLPTATAPLKYGQCIWVELKAPGKTATAMQHREHLRMMEMGQRVEVINSLAGVDELLGEI